MKLGVFGGTFDPPHMGHLVVAQEVLFRLGLHRLLWIPAAVPPHKQGREITPGPLRLEMVRTAIAADPRFEASDMELRREGPSFTVDTLRELQAAQPGNELFLILGADQLSELDTWKEPEEVARLASLVGFARAGETPSVMTGVQVVEVPRIDISSTEVRRRVRAGEPIAYLVPAAVEAVIRREGIYGGARPL